MVLSAGLFSLGIKVLPKIPQCQMRFCELRNCRGLPHLRCQTDAVNRSAMKLFKNQVGVLESRHSIFSAECMGGALHLSCIPCTKDLQLIYMTCLTYAKAFLGSTYIFNTFLKIINIGFCLLAHVQSSCGASPETFRMKSELHCVHWANSVFMHAQ